MKKRVIIILVSLLLIVVIIGLAFLIKGEWKESMSTFGPLNTEDDFGMTSYTMSEKNDFYISGYIRVKKGSVSCTVTYNGDEIYEDTLHEGDNQINTDIIEDADGEILIEIIASDDADGDYNIAVYTRERMLNRFIRRIKENF